MRNRERICDSENEGIGNECEMVGGSRNSEALKIRRIAVGIIGGNQAWIWRASYDHRGS